MTATNMCSNFVGFRYSLDIKKINHILKILGNGGEGVVIAGTENEKNKGRRIKMF